MDVSIIFEILKFTIPAVIVFFTAHLSLKSFLNNYLKTQELKLKENTRQLTAPIRLQAYERLALLLERIDLFGLLQRLRAPNMTVAELQLLMINQIRMEFDHNLSQQIYISNELWQQVRSTKEEVIMTINRIGMQLPPNAPAKELNLKIYDYLNELDGVLPTNRTLEFLKKEAQTIL